MVTTTDTSKFTASDTIDGLDVTLDATLPNFATESFEANVDISTDGIAPQINVALVIDTSGSTSRGSGSDVDGDGNNDTFLQAEQFAAKAVFQSLLDAGYPPEDVTITVVAYSGGSRLVGEYTLAEQDDFEDDIDALGSRGATNFEAGLDRVIETWNTRNGDDDPDNNVDATTTNSVIFLSDGVRNRGDDASDEAQTLLNSFDAPITAIGVGSNAVIGQLNLIDTTPRPGPNDAQIVVDVADLADVINAPPPLPELESVQFFVDGELLLEVPRFLPNGDPNPDLLVTSFGFRVDCAKIEGYDDMVGQVLDVDIKAVFNNGMDVLAVGDIRIPQTICFVEGTQLLTPSGLVAVEALTAGMRIVTRDHGAQPIKWIGQTRVTKAMQRDHPELRPIHIRANALGAAQPERDLYLSRQHKVLVRDWRAEMEFGSSDGVLVPAAALVNDATITVDHTRDDGLTYWHIACETHEVVYADGVECETFYPSARVIAGLSEEARAEFLRLFPDLELNEDLKQTARPSVPMRIARTLSQ